MPAVSIVHSDSDCTVIGGQIHVCRCLVFQRKVLLSRAVMSLIYWTAWTVVLVENLLVSQLFGKYSAFYGTWRFIIMFSRPCQINPVYTLGSILILFTHLHLCIWSGPFPQSFLTKTLLTPPLFPICAVCRTHLTLHFIIQISSNHEVLFSSSLIKEVTQIVIRNTTYVRKLKKEIRFMTKILNIDRMNKYQIPQVNIKYRLLKERYKGG